MTDEKKQYPRSKLQLTEAAADPKSFGDRGGQVLNFRAKFTGPESSPWLGQVIGFGCFKKDLFTTIQATAVGSTLECDIETKPYPAQDGERLNYTVNQIYVDGQPVAGKGQNRGNYSDADSPEKRKSIEDQTRAERITELWIAGKIPDDDPLISKLRTWLEKLESPTKNIEPSKKSNPPEEGEEWPSLKNLGGLYTRGKTFGLSPRDVLAAVMQNNPDITKAEEITDFNKAWIATATKFASTIKAAQEADK